MWLKYLLEAGLAIAMMGLAASFWSLVKAPGHLRQLLSDKEEIREIVQFLKSRGLVAESDAVEPSFGSFADNIRLFETAHLKGFRQSCFTVAGLAAAILVGSYFMGYVYLLVNLALFVLPALFPPVVWAKNQNVTHLHTVMLNLIKWRAVEPVGVVRYCQEEKPELATLYSVLGEEIPE